MKHCSLLLVLLLFSPTVLSKQEGERDQPWWKRLGVLRRRLQGPRFQFKKKKETSFQPVIVEDFLSAEEAAELLKRYEPLLRESQHFSKTGGVRSQYRTSRSIRLPPLGDHLVFDIEQRAAALANTSLSSVEDFQLACYRPTELYGLHRDDSEKAEANRAATVLIYLQAPQAGGSTLFTLTELEQEKDLETKRPLNTEQGAIKLFQHYCKHPKRHHVVVDAVVGRAVTWRNWKNNNHETTQEFIKESTHGACPVVEGQKCVIQQWIVRNHQQQPLRKDNLLAIFPVGADVSYGGTGRYDNSNDEEQHCLRDVSTQRGQHVPALCGRTGNSNIKLIDDGPYNNIGAMRVVVTGGGGGGGWTTTLPVQVLQEQQGVTILFWIFNINTGLTLFSVNGTTTLRAVEGNRLELFHFDDNNNEHVETIQMDEKDCKDWLWVAVFLGSNSTEVTVHARDGTVLGRAKQNMNDVNIEDSCPEKKRERVELRLFTPTSVRPQQQPNKESTTSFVGIPVKRSAEETNNVAFASSPPASLSVDVSFLLFYAGDLNDDEAALLRRQAKRYDILT